MPKPTRIYTLRVELRDITPSIWRRIQLEGSDSLRKVHHILQAVFGWTDAHLHEFEIGDKTYVMMDVDDVDGHLDPSKTFDDRKTKLEKVVDKGMSLVYKYDFGDGWEHDIIVEDVEIIEGDPPGYAFVVDGARACPPEDVGGPYGYHEFLATLRRRPNSEEAQHYRLWAGKDFDAELFDRHAANAALLRMASNRWGGK